MKLGKLVGDQGAARRICRPAGEKHAGNPETSGDASGAACNTLGTVLAEHASGSIAGCQRTFWKANRRRHGISVGAGPNTNLDILR